MASSGWQGQKDIQTGVYPHMALNLRIDSISHSGTTLTYTGVVQVKCTSGTINYNNATVTLTGGGSKTINLNLSSGGTVNTGTFSCTISNVSASTTSKSVTASLSAGSTASGSASWTLTFNTSTSPPTGLYINNVSSTWNSVTGTVGLTSYGTGSGTKQLNMLVLTQPYVAGVPHRYESTTSGAMSYTFTVTNNSSVPAAGAIDIKGAGTYYTGVYANNGSEVARYAGGTIATPPSPLQSITYTETQGDSSVTINLTITGGSSSDNNSNTVTTSYRYSTNGGSTYSAWTSAGTGTPWTAKTASFTCNYGASVVVQAKQTYSSKDSTVKQISFTAPSGTAPTGLYINNVSATWDSVTGTVGLTSYGHGSGTKRLSMLVLTEAYVPGLPHRYTLTPTGAMSGTVTVDNSSAAGNQGGIDIKGCGFYYTGVFADNGTLQSRDQGPTVYTPPSPVVLNYSRVGSSDQWQITMTGDPNKNNSDYVTAQLNRTLRYKIDNGVWTTIENAEVKLLDAVTTATITIPAQSTATIEGWMTYQSQDSEVSSFAIFNGDAPVHLYGSVSGQTEEIVHLYGPVDGHTKKISKLYASVGGVTKLIFRDTS